MFACPKMIATSWPKVIRPFADGDDVAVNWPTLWLHCFFQDRRHSGPSLFVNTAAYTVLDIGQPEGVPCEHMFTTAHALWSGARKSLHISVSLVYYIIHIQLTRLLS